MEQALEELASLWWCRHRMDSVLVVPVPEREAREIRRRVYRRHHLQTDHRPRKGLHAAAAALVWDELEPERVPGSLMPVPVRLAAEVVEQEPWPKMRCAWHRIVRFETMQDPC